MRSVVSRSKRLQPRASCTQPRQSGPVVVTLALGNALEKMVSDQARDRHRHRLGVGRRQRQSHVFQRQRHLEATAGDFLLGDDGPIGLVDRRREQCPGEAVEKAARVYAGFANERERLSQTLQHRRDQEVAGEFGHICIGGIFADHDGSLAHGIKQRAATRDRRVRSFKDENIEDEADA
jgi:hypothetical protein